MANKYQRKVNKVVRTFNKGFERDIHPYNVFSVKQFKVLPSREGYFENMYLLHLYKADKLVSTKWLDYLEIVGAGKQVVGREMFWWVNNEVAKSVNVDL